MRRASVTVMFSGGTDSTLTSALMQEQFDTVHLVTFHRFGFHRTENTQVNARMLQARFGRDRYRHTVIPIDRLFRFVSYERYLHHLLRHGFFVLATCGLCKLAMHVRTVKYCLEHGIRHACDGANQGMTMFPDQMLPVILETRKMYAQFGIEYFNPVFDLQPPEDGSFIKAANRQFIERFMQTPGQPEAAGPQDSPGHRLHRMGLAPTPNVKGTPYDRLRQPRCFQLILFNIFAIRYYLAAHTYDEYRDRTVVFFRDKIARMTDLLAQHVASGRYARLFEPARDLP